MKAFFVHRQYNIKDKIKYRGFTVYISPAWTNTHVTVSFTFCSKKDQFNKSLGRQNALVSHNQQLIHKKDVPKFVAQLEEIALGYGKVENPVNLRAFFYIYKYLF